MYNKAILIGNLGRDPEIRYTQGGMAVASFSLATNDRRKDSKTGEWQDHTEWFRVSVFGKMAETCSQYLSKGSKVYIEGRIRSSEWEDREGKKRFSIEIIASELKMLTPRGAAESSAMPMASGSDLAPAEPSFNAPEDDIPF